MGFYISNDIRMFFVGGISLGGVLVGLESREHIVRRSTLGELRSVA